jgi:hypothetical protein
MRQTDYRTLVSRGRKAGLGTAELYRALASRPSAETDQGMGQADSNGFVAGFNHAGQRVYRPAGHPYPRP